MLAGKVSPNESPFGVDTISNFMENGLPLLLEEMNEKGINLKWIDINDFVKCLTEENLCRKQLHREKVL